MKRDEFAHTLEQALLRPDVDRRSVEEACAAAVRDHLGALVVLPCYVRIAAPLLAGSGVKPVSVVGFPLGATLSEVKAREARLLFDQGAEELDMVLHLPWFFSREYDAVREDIAGVVQEARGHVVKVILETSLLDEGGIVKACQLARDAGASFVKTSTGFGGGGATEEAVGLMRRTLGNRMGIKASGGIRTLDQALSLLEAGADRLGTSGAMDLLAQWDQRFRG